MSIFSTDFLCQPLLNPTPLSLLCHTDPDCNSAAMYLLLASTFLRLLPADTPPGNLYLARLDSAS